MTMTYISLFSGIGGFDLGFERAGMKCVAQVEWDAKASAVLARHWPNVPHFEDVRNVGRHNLPDADVLCGGFPCQDVSVAGRRKGLAGERSGLWFEFLRILGELKTRTVVIENVPGLLSSNGGRDFAVILHGLVERGYCVAWRILDAQHFGVAQRRRRVFIVGSLGDGRAAEILFEREGVSRHPQPGGAARERTAATVSASAPSRRNGGSDPTDGHFIIEPNVDTAYALSAAVRGTGDGHGNAWNSNYVTYAEQRSDQYAAASVDATLAARDGNGVRTVVALSSGDGADISPTLTGEGHDGSEDGRGRKAFVIGTLSPGAHPDGFNGQDAYSGHLIVEAIDVRNFRSNGDISGTLQAKKSDGYSLNYQNPIAISTPLADSGVGVRRLTPTECERLQGFPDGWTAFSADGKPQSDSARYRQLGNAVCVPVAEWLARRLPCAARSSPRERP